MNQTDDDLGDATIGEECARQNDCSAVDANAKREVKTSGLKKFTIAGGILGFVLAALIYIAFPYEVLNWFMPNYQQLLAEWFPCAPVIIIDWTQLKPLFERWLFAGIPLAAIASITWACRKGGRMRFLSSTAYLAASIIWFVYVINFGDLSGLINVTVNEQNYRFGIVLASMLYLIILFKALKFLVIYGKYKDARDDYLNV